MNTSSPFYPYKEGAPAALLPENPAQPAACEHVYSKSMDQEYPRRCIKCREPEGPPMVTVVEKQELRQVLPCFPSPLPTHTFLNSHNAAFAKALETLIRKLVKQGAQNIKVKWVNNPGADAERASNFAYHITAERILEYLAPEDEV